MNDRSYIVISAVRNEGPYVERTIASMRSQTQLPLKWMIVDDGSKDNTAALTDAAAAEAPWIERVSRKDRGFRQPGVGVVEAFYAGFERVKDLPWSYVVKMDGDLLLPKEYFERLMTAFETEDRLGICSGDIFNETATGLALDSPSDPAFHVRGAAKMYRRACWDAIGGLQRVTGFDSIDNVKARMTGWDTRRLHEVPVIHLRHTGQAGGTWRNGYKNGIGANAIGYHPLFVVVKCLKRLVRGSPVDALGQGCGFIAGYFVSIPRVQDQKLIRYLRQQQLNRLLGRASIWR